MAIEFRRTLSLTRNHSSRARRDDERPGNSRAIVADENVHARRVTWQILASHGDLVLLQVVPETNFGVIRGRE